MNYRNISLPSQITIQELKEHGLTISLDVYNTGHMDGEDVVQVYIKHIQSSIVSRVLELKGFQKVFVPHQTFSTVTITLGYEDLAIWNIDMDNIVELGKGSLYWTRLSKLSRILCTSCKELLRWLF